MQEVIIEASDKSVERRTLRYFLRAHIILFGLIVVVVCGVNTYGIIIIDKVIGGKGHVMTATIPQRFVFRREETHCIGRTQKRVPIGSRGCLASPIRVTVIKACRPFVIDIVKVEAACKRQLRIVICSCIGRAVETEVLVLLHLYVDDAGRTFRIVFRRRIGDDFEFFHLLRVHTFKHCLYRFPAEPHVSAVELEQHAALPVERKIIVLVYCHSGNLSQQIESRYHGCRCRLINIHDEFIRIHLVTFYLGNHFRLLQFFADG